jgi:hypothetical protein
MGLYSDNQYCKRCCRPKPGSLAVARGEVCEECQVKAKRKKGDRQPRDARRRTALWEYS